MFRRALSVAVSVSVLAGGLAVLPWSAVPAAAEVVSPADLPPLPSVAEPKVEPRLVEGDFSNSPPTVSEVGKVPTVEVPSFDPAVSTVIDGELSPVRKVFANADGTRTAMLSSGPVRFQDGAGVWKDIDLSLVARGDGWLGAKSAAESARVPAVLSSAGVVVAPTSAGDVVLSHPDALPVPVAVSGRTATYPGGLPGGRDVVVSLTTSGFEESVVVPAASAAGTYREQLLLPAGVTARAGGSGVELVDASAAVIAGFGGGWAFDSAGSESAVTTSLVSQTGRVAIVDVAADPAWLAAPGRVFPVTIDPSFYANTAQSGAADTFVENGLGSQWASSELRVGTFNGGGNVARSLLRFDLGSVPAPTLWVSEAHVTIFNSWSFSCTARGVELDGLGAGFGSSTTWSTQPGLDADPTVSSTSFARGYSAADCPGGWQDLDATALARRWFDTSRQNFGLELSASDEWDSLGWKKFHSAETGSSSAPALYVTYTTVPDPATAKSPEDKAVVVSTTPTLVVNPATDPNGSPVQYWFKVATGSDGESGAIVANSGWVSSTSWTPPLGALADGGVYYWRVWTFDGTIWRDPGWVRKLTVNLRLGSASASPTDSAGPVSVNLASGNVALSTATPSFPTAGGSLGLSFSYNSKAPPDLGLKGEYFKDTDHDRTFNDGPAAMTRQDPLVYMDWGAEGPSPALGSDYFLVRWTGYITAPVTGAYYIGGASDDGMRVWLDDVPVHNRWATGADSGPVFGSGMNFVAGTSHKIKIEYYEATGGAFAKLHYRLGSSGPAPAVPSDWLSGSARVLPDGWSMSADGDGPAAVSRLSVANNSVTVNEVDGTTHVFSRAGSVFTAPADEPGAVLAVASDGTYTFHAEDGTTYTFATDGTLVSASSAGLSIFLCR